MKKVGKLRRFNARTLLLQIRSPRREERDAAHSASQCYALGRIYSRG